MGKKTQYSAQFSDEDPEDPDYALNNKDMENDESNSDSSECWDLVEDSQLNKNPGQQ